jgi:ketosteroid isomerase-like protein
LLGRHVNLKEIAMTTVESVGTANRAAVIALYEAFGRGDLPAIVEHLADDVSWDADWADNFAQRTEIDHFLPRRGLTQVMEFFQLVGSFTIHSFEVQDVLVGADRVACVILIDATKPNGGRYRDEEMHLWTFNAEGKVSALRHYIDTAKHLAAARGEDTTIGR